MLAWYAGSHFCVWGLILGDTLEELEVFRVTRELTVVGASSLCQEGASLPPVGPVPPALGIPPWGSAFAPTTLTDTGWRPHTSLETCVGSWTSSPWLVTVTSWLYLTFWWLPVQPRLQETDSNRRGTSCVVA